MTSPEVRPEFLLDLQVPATLVGMDVVHTALAGCWSSLETVRPLKQRWRDEFSLAVAEVRRPTSSSTPMRPHPLLVEFTLLLEHAPDHLQARFIDGGIMVTPPEYSRHALGQSLL